MGAVTAFNLPADYLDQFEVQTVGSAIHQELWVPAEKLDEFNQQINGLIRVVSAFYGEQYRGERAW